MLLRRAEPSRTMAAHAPLVDESKKSLVTVEGLRFIGNRTPMGLSGDVTVRRVVIEDSDQAMTVFDGTVDAEALQASRFTRAPGNSVAWTTSHYVRLRAICRPAPRG